MEAWGTESSVALSIVALGFDVHTEPQLLSRATGMYRPERVPTFGRITCACLHVHGLVALQELAGVPLVLDLTLHSHTMPTVHPSLVLPTHPPQCHAVCTLLRSATA